VNLSGNELCGINPRGQGVYNADGIKAIADSITVTASLTSVNLSSNNLAGETGYVKADRVQGTSFEVGDKVTYEGREMIVSKGKDRDGDIRMIDGGQSGVKAIAEAIRVTASLTSINLKENNLGPAGAKALAPALRDSASVTSIDVGYNNIGQSASLELLAAMKGKHMVSIGMANCELGVEGSRVVAEMISVMASLTYLW
jgi:hypothetical protein